MNRATPSARKQKPGAKRSNPAKAAAPAESPQVAAAPAVKTGTQAKVAPRPRPSKADVAVSKDAEEARPREIAAAPAEKPKRPKLIRDSFTMPDTEYQALVDIKKACLQAGLLVKKSELLRIGVALVRGLDAAAIKRQQSRLVPLAPGRPKKHKKDAAKVGKKV